MPLNRYGETWESKITTLYFTLLKLNIVSYLKNIVSINLSIMSQQCSKYI